MSSEVSLSCAFAVITENKAVILFIHWFLVFVRPKMLENVNIWCKYIQINSKMIKVRHLLSYDTESWDLNAKLVALLPLNQWDFNKKQYRSSVFISYLISASLFTPHLLQTALEM